MHVSDHSAVAGFTLLEMIVAFVILSTSLAIATQAIGLASRGAVAADERETAIELLQDIRIRQLRLASGEIADAKGHTWKVSIHAPTGDAFSNAEVSSVKLISPRGTSFRFLVPNSVSERKGAAIAQ